MHDGQNSPIYSLELIVVKMTVFLLIIKACIIVPNFFCVYCILLFSLSKILKGKGHYQNAQIAIFIFG